MGTPQGILQIKILFLLNILPDLDNHQHVVKRMINEVEQP